MGDSQVTPKQLRNGISVEVGAHNTAEFEAPEYTGPGDAAAAMTEAMTEAPGQWRDLSGGVIGGRPFGATLADAPPLGQLGDKEPYLQNADAIAGDANRRDHSQ